MDIVKQLNRNVTFSRSGVIIQTLLEDVTAVLNHKRNGIIITDVRGKSVEVFTRQIENTQILPAGAIKFQPQGTVDLWNLLFDPTGTVFFNELHIYTSGSGPVIQDNWKTIAVATYTPLIGDYLLKITVNSTITLPLISTINIGQVYRFFLVNVTAKIDTTGANSFIDGSKTLTRKKYNMITLRACDINTWAWGD
jgi:hypothetical protein